MSSVAPEYGTYSPDSISAEKAPRHAKAWAIIIAKIQAYIQFRKIKKGLKEVELMESGKKDDKPIDQLLNEL